MGFLSFAMWLISCDQITVEVLTKQRFTVEVQTEKKPAAQAPARRKKHCIVMVSAEWCGPCRIWKRDKKKTLEDLGYEVRIIDSDTRPDWKKHANALPTFWIVDYETWSLRHKITGAVSPESIAAKADAMSVTVETVTQKTVTLSPPQRSNSIYGLRGTSHESRSTLIRHLFNDGIHRGRHSMQSLNAMGDFQLDALHKQDHGW